jgi:hypothetical protein
MKVTIKKTPEEKLLAKAEKEATADRKRIERNLLSQLSDLRCKHINEPVNFFKVGEQVKFGNWTNSFVKEVLDNGKIYLISHFVVAKKDNADIEVKDYVPWHRLAVYMTPEEISKTKKLSFREEVRITHSNSVINSLIYKYYDGCDMSPEYQRGLVWDLNDKISLMDSIFNNVDIGKFTLIELPFSHSGPSYEILDGKQRLSTIIEFFESRFEYKGLKFSQMHPRDRHHFEDYPILYAQSSGLTFAQKCNYFLKLNTTGKPQDPKHLEKVKALAKTES